MIVPGIVYDSCVGRERRVPEAVGVDRLYVKAPCPVDDVCIVRDPFEEGREGEGRWWKVRLLCLLRCVPCAAAAAHLEAVRAWCRWRERIRRYLALYVR